MKIEDYNAIRERAKTKKNGIYSYKGQQYTYIVVDNQLAGYCDYFGNLYELSYGFNISKGKAKDRFEAKEILKGYLKQLVK